MTQVNETNMAKWIVALRSGKYTQTRGQLCDDRNAMCCLGVLCEISALGVWEGTGLGRSYVVGDWAKSGLPPLQVIDWAGLHQQNPWLGRATCSTANDVDGWSFEQIADALEEGYLPGKKAEEILEAASV